MLKVAEFARGLDIVAQRRAAGRDGIAQYGLDGGHQTLGPGPGNAGAEAFRRNAGAVQALAGIDVADAGDQVLIEQQGLDGRTPAREGRGKHRAGEVVAKGVGAHIAQQGVIV